MSNSCFSLFLVRGPRKHERKLAHEFLFVVVLSIFLVDSMVVGVQSISVSKLQVFFFCAVVLLGGSSVVASSTRERPERKGAHVLLRDRSVFGQCSDDCVHVPCDNCFSLRTIDQESFPYHCESTSMARHGP